MRLLISLVSYLKWIGLLGLPIFISEALIWKVLWSFWLFGLIELIFSIPMTIQSLGQMISSLINPLINQPVPNIYNYNSEVKYSLPFRGEWLTVNGGVDKGTSHSWSITSQRYAYDFVKIDDQLKTYKGDRKNLNNYYCYGNDVLAPADGTVVKLSNRSKDSKIMWNNSADPLIKDIRGNYITIKHAKGEYSVIAHLKPDTMLVKEGDQVKRFQKIAECGNSGNTTEPHIHFQVQNRKSFIFSAGLPIEFKDIKAHELKSYEKIDPRPIKSDINYLSDDNAYIRRGLLVSNCKE